MRIGVLMLPTDPYRDATPAAVQRRVTAQADLLAGHCAAIGRDPATIDRIYLIGNTPERPLASLSAFTEFVGRYRELASPTSCSTTRGPTIPCGRTGPEIVEAIAAEVLPGLCLAFH